MSHLRTRWPSRVANLRREERVGESEGNEDVLCSVHGCFVVKDWKNPWTRFRRV